MELVFYFKMYELFLADERLSSCEVSSIDDCA